MMHELQQQKIHQDELEGQFMTDQVALQGMASVSVIVAGKLLMLPVDREL